MSVAACSKRFAGTLPGTRSPSADFASRPGASRSKPPLPHPACQITLLLEDSQRT